MNISQVYGEDKSLLIENFLKNGFLILKSAELLNLKNVLHKEMSELNGILSERLELDLQKDVLNDLPFITQLEELYKREKDHQATRAMYELYPSLPSVNGLLNQHFFLNAAKAVGIDLPIASTLPIVRVDRPNQKRFLTPIHQDSWFSLLSKKSVTFWFMVTQHQKSMGPLDVIPGSHKLGTLPVRPFNSQNPFTTQKEFKDEEFTSVFLDEDEALLFDQNLVHKSSTNQSQAPRLSIQIRYSDAFTLNSMTSSYVVKNTPTVIALQEKLLAKGEN